MWDRDGMVRWWGWDRSDTMGGVWVCVWDTRGREGEWGYVGQDPMETGMDRSDRWARGTDQQDGGDRSDGAQDVEQDVVLDVER